MAEQKTLKIAKINVNGTSYLASDSEAASELNTIYNVFEFEPVTDGVTTNDHYFAYGGTSPGEASGHSFIRIPCKAGDIFKVSFKNSVGTATPCFVQNSSSQGIKAIITYPSDADADKDIIFTIPANGAYLVLNYYTNSTSTPPSVYRYKTTDTSAFGLPSWWFGALEKVKGKITSEQNSFGVNGFTFGFITDTHAENTYGGRYANLMKYILNACEIPVFLHGGDIVAGEARSSKDKLISELKHHKEVFKDIEDKCLLALGNHDASYGENDNYDGALSEGETYNYIFRGNESKNGIVRGDTGRYYYKDNDVQKVRYIILDCFALSENPMLNPPQFGESQLNWLAEALKVEDGYSIVICSHIPPATADSFAEIGWDSDSVIKDCEIALEIVNAYRNSTTYAITTTIQSKTYNINVDYSDAKGEVICWMAGHVHSDYIVDADGLKIVCTTNCGGGGSFAGTSISPSKTHTTDTEHAMDFVCVDKENRAVSVVRLGAKISDNDEIRVFSYS